MMRTKILIAAAALCSFATTAWADPASFALRLEGHVPVICRVQLDSMASGETSRMTEFCNNASGYEVWLRHAQGLNDAAVYVDGRRVELSATGSTLISRSATAGLAARDIRLEAGAAEIQTVALQIVTL